jgi:hypothetical protein
VKTGTKNKFKWALSYPSRPERGRWHKIDFDFTDRAGQGIFTLCGTKITEGWRRVKNFPLMDDSVTNRVCKHCYKKDPTP